MIDRKQPENVE